MVFDTFPWGAARHATVCATPEGYDAILLAEAARKSRRDVLHIARDDARVARLRAALTFFAPEVEVLILPAWDCLPYDRASPHKDIAAQRVDTLVTLTQARPAGAPPRIVLTTVNGATQRVPAFDTLRGAAFVARPGDRLAIQELVAHLERHGYVRTGTVMEPGEYAVRGGIVDIFAPGAEDPVRVDLFGDVVETIRRFDPVSQRSTDDLTHLDLRPVSEISLDAESIARFRAGYRELFGVNLDDDSLYQSVLAGTRHAGMEHWLPLFHAGLDTVFAYLPDAVIGLDPLADESRAARATLVEEYYQTRKSPPAAAIQPGVPPYRPLPPERLYLDEAEWRRLIAVRASLRFSPFKIPEQADGTVIDAGGAQGRDFAAERNRPGGGLFDALRAHIDARRSAKRVVLACYSAGSRDRLALLLADHGIEGLVPVDDGAALEGLAGGAVALAVLPLERGFETDFLVVISEEDVFGERLVRSAQRRRRPANVIMEASALAEGDLVVHREHGIGRYLGLVTIDVGGASHDCLSVQYHGGDKLFVPVENIEVLSRYGPEEMGASLDRLGGTHWQARKARLKNRIREMADALIRIAAERQLRHGETILAPEGLYEEFAARFPYTETDDQSRAIEETLNDLRAGRPMDRLICGDVGYGKTEVAVRAAFSAVMAGYQVAVIVPTTLLCRQHARTMGERLTGFPIRIAQLSRLVPPKEAAAVKSGLEQGTIDLVIGTHALLGKGVKFKRLGLMVVDEEQHFGVAHKEKLKQLRADVHVLTLTATPIPRTLHMALSGLRELSVISTPPVDRLAVRTFVLPYDPVIVREALLREHYRGGQSFFVCPRIEDLEKLEGPLRGLLPELKIAVAHGRQAPQALEGVMGSFYEAAFDVLLCTAIVESGLDIPRANTIVIYRADRFGLAQLYQLRGRVGRSKQRAYAYLMLPPGRILTNTAEQRLEVMQKLDSLGAGFTLASHDLDIRGAGNLLGEEQSGHIREVGVELYQQMLEEAVAAAKGVVSDAGDWSPQISLGTSVRIPETYVADLDVRLGLYRRLATLLSRPDVDAFAAELIDRFGPLPDEVRHLLDVVAMKPHCRAAGIERIEAGPKGAVLAFRDNSFANPSGLVAFIATQVGTAKLRPDHRLVFRRDWNSEEDRLAGARRLVLQLADIARAGQPAAAPALV